MVRTLTYSNQWTPLILYRIGDKSLARPGRKQANVSVRMAWISFSTLPCRGKKNLMTARVSILLKSRLSLTCFWACFFLVGLRTYQHPGSLWWRYISPFSLTKNETFSVWAFLLRTTDTSVSNVSFDIILSIMGNYSVPLSNALNCHNYKVFAKYLIKHLIICGFDYYYYYKA